MDLSYKNEREIVEWAASRENPTVCFYPIESDLGHRLLASLRGQTLIQRERPDFEDIEERLLVEVMIVDDHPRPRDKDATRAREAAMLREVEAAGLAEMFPNASLTAIANTGLPTDEDHNFQAYFRHFSEVVDKHARNVDVYRRQGPGFDLGFVIFDESTAYYEIPEPSAKDGLGRIHAHFADESFLAVLGRSGADCVAWLSPYKHATTDEGVVPLPGLTIIDVTEINRGQNQSFDVGRMKSYEM